MGNTSIQQQRERGVRIQWSRFELLDLRKNQTSLLPEQVRVIRQLKIHKRNKRGQRGGIKSQEKKGINIANLRVIEVTDNTVMNNYRQLKISTWNAHLIKNKAVLLRDHLLNNGIDMCVITETWLQTRDQIWIEGCDLNNNGLCMLSSFRGDNRRGGGLSLVTVTTLVSKTIKSDTLRTIEYHHWHVKGQNLDVNVLGIYRPPYSKQHQSTVSDFIKEFLTLLESWLPANNNIVIAGDFNIHIDDKEDTNACSFVDSMDAIGLDIRVDFATHGEGNHLDLIITESIWDNEDIKNQKKVVRRREEVWRKYRQTHQWIAYKKCRNFLQYMIKAEKRESISTKIHESRANTKKLYQIVNNLVGKKDVNPMPEGKTNKELANEFADFFLQKILKIRESLANKSKYCPTYRKVPTFTLFASVSEETVERTIKEMPTKHCELDIVPTKFLKGVLKGLVPHITRLINVSLQQGVFMEKWKCAVVRAPLLKKVGLDFIII
ncbi:uncharacterized protein LOC144448196 [Glandiceps talaboti]